MGLISSCEKPPTSEHCGWLAENGWQLHFGDYLNFCGLVDSHKWKALTVDGKRSPKRGEKNHLCSEVCAPWEQLKEIQRQHIVLYSSCMSWPWKPHKHWVSDDDGGLADFLDQYENESDHSKLIKCGSSSSFPLKILTGCHMFIIGSLKMEMCTKFRGIYQICSVIQIVLVLCSLHIIWFPFRGQWPMFRVTNGASGYRQNR